MGLARTGLGLRSSELKRWLPLLLILAVGAFLRFYQISAYGLWTDEFVTLQLATQPTYAAVAKTCFVIPQPIPPFYFLLEKASVDWLGVSEISLRLLSALSGSLTIILLFWLGKELSSASVGIIAALLFSLQPVQILYAQNARAYAFCLMLSTAAVLAFLKWMKTGRLASQIVFVITATLLFCSHYVFAPLMLVLNIYYFGIFFWSRKKTVVSWKRWLGVQLLIGVLLLPLLRQMQQLLRARHSLNWSSHVPELKDFFHFVDFPSLKSSLLIAVGLGLVWFLGRWITGKCGWLQPIAFSSQSTVKGGDASQPLFLFLVWFFLPPSLFALLYLTTGLNLFVDNYLLLTSLPTYLLTPALALRLPEASLRLKDFLVRWRAKLASGGQVCRVQPPASGTASPVFQPEIGQPGLVLAWLFLIVLVGYSAYNGPWLQYKWHGRFCWGVPGGNQWRESLQALDNPVFDAPLFLFQSPFIESNDLTYGNDAALQKYLSAPLYSFYVSGRHPQWVLLPVFWPTENEAHQKFKDEIKQKIQRQPHFLLLCEQAFREDFSAWLEKEFAGTYKIATEASFQSSSVLLIQQIQLVPRDH